MITYPSGVNFYGIANQVEENLRNPERVAGYVFRHDWPYTDLHVQALLKSLVADDCDEIVYQSPKTEARRLYG